MARQRNFSVDREPIELGLGGDTFHAPAVIAPAVLAEMLGMQAGIGEIQKTTGSEADQITQILKALDELLGLILVPESAKRFHDRLYSRDKPLDLMREVLPAVEWLIEEYTDRPTQPSPPSQTGLSDGGATSTAGALPAELTPAISPPTGSSTSPTT